MPYGKRMFLSKAMFDSLTIIGPGLLGASIAMSAMEGKLAQTLHVWARSDSKRKRCSEAPWCDRVHESLEDAVKDSDLILLCTPVDTMIPLLESIVPHLKAGALVTDVGSVKRSICEGADQIAKQIPLNFIGSHPMAGSEKGGMEHASHDLLKGAPCILTPTEQTDSAQLQSLNAFWTQLEMRTSCMSPQAHDSLIARISHLPHIVASLLAASLDDIPEDAFSHAGGGLKDTTRIAGGNPDLWQSILAENNEAVLHSISAFESVLETLKSSLENKDFDRLNQILKTGQSVRKRIEHSDPFCS